MSQKSKPWRVLTAVSSVLLATMLGVTAGATAYKSLLCSYIGGETFRIEDSENAETINAYATNGLSLQEQKDAGDKKVQEVVGEGAVLLKNENDALPLKKNSNVTLFSRSSVDVVLGGTGGGGIKSDRLVDLKAGFESNGLNINQTIWDFYENYTAEHGLKRSNGGWMGATPEQTFIAEVDPSNFTKEVKDSYADYNDAAIVVISRIGGEGSDMPTGKFGDGDKYLALQEAEKNLLKEIKNSGQFEKIVVLINTSNAMELGWVDLAEYGIDSCMWIGGIGQSGANSIAKLLVGDLNPSGKLVDTYAADSLSSPAMQNFGDYTFDNASILPSTVSRVGNKYVVYSEGIYVGYRYYETRYADSVLDANGTNAKSSSGAFVGNGWNYTDEVVYPFGYGLSYGSQDGTPFTQKLVGTKVSSDTITFEVEVTNDGTVAGKEVVQIYGQAPYTKGGTEKSAIQLVGFEKTDIIQPGKSEKVTVVVDKYDIASYDYVAEKTYVLDEGTYYFATGNGAHDALNNVLAARGKTVDDGMDYDGNADLVYKWNNTGKDLLNKSKAGATVTNLFDHAGLDYYGIETEYLTRSDWNTFPKTVENLSLTDEMVKDIDADANYEPGSSDLSEITIDTENTYNIAMMYGEPFDSDAWDTLINQMTIEELALMAGGSGLSACESIGYPAMFMKDGPAGENVRPYVEDGTYPTGFCSEVVMASTFNKELIYEVGQIMGEDWLRTDTEAGYAPGSNTHRTPYSGRNFEYFSEDGYIAGVMTAYEVRGMEEKGMIAMPKHFFLNDQETNRQGLCTFTNEQAIREIYLKAFEDAFVDEKVKGTMGAFNRIGCVWAGADVQVNKALLRVEWGWTGIIDTDIAVNTALQSPLAGLESGLTMFATSGKNFYNYIMQYAPTDTKLVENLRESAHYILYNISTSSGMNGLSKSAKIVSVMPYWQKIAIGACIALVVIDAVAIALTIVTEIKGRKAKEE